MTSRHLVASLALAALCLAAPARAQQGERGGARAAVKDGGKAKPASIIVTPEREAAVVTFVQRNHPELEKLLRHLKESQSKEYERAVKELYRVTERLAQVQERDPEQYELELRLWQVQSRLQLLAARLKMGASEDLRQQMKETLAEQIDVRLAMLRRERDRLADRKEKVERELQNLDNQRSLLVEKQLEQILAGAPKDPPKPGPGKRPTGKSEATSKSESGDAELDRRSESAGPTRSRPSP